MSEQITNPAGDVTEVPPAAAFSGDGAEQQPEIVETPAAPVVEEPAKQTVIDFKSRFSQASEKAKSVIADAIDDGKGGGEGDKDGKSKDGEADDQIPADKDAKPADDPSEPDESKEGDDAKEDPAKETSRSRSFKEIQAENEQLKTESQTQKGRVDALEQKFEEYGGLDVVESAMGMFEKLAEGNAAEVINELPPHQKAAIVDSILSEVISDPGRRVESINNVLANDFGLKTPLSMPLLEKAFEYIVERVNSDAEDFDSYLDWKLESLSTPESELERTKRELANLKNGDSGQEKAAEETASAPVDQMVVVQKATELYDEFELSTFKAVAEPILGQYGFDVKPNDTPAVKAAKETLAGALDSYIAEQMRSAQAFKPLLPYWLESGGDPAALEALKGNQFFTNSVATYQRAMKAKAEGVVKSIATLLRSASANPNTPSLTEPRSANTPTVPNSAGTKPVAVEGQRKPESDKPKGFSSAFEQAKTTALRG